MTKHYGLIYMRIFIYFLEAKSSGGAYGGYSFLCGK
ncbi:hypothetical protein DJ55_3619 [Yersinia pseudotuberculosis]|nr:hypothetical protein DJ55_3619 [Yersinia pseudotuberculosis]